MPTSITKEITVVVDGPDVYLLRELIGYGLTRIDSFDKDSWDVKKLESLREFGQLIVNNTK